MYTLKESLETIHLLNPLSPHSNGWYRSNVSISLSATPSAVKTEYRINGGSWTVYNGPFTLSAEGTNKVEYRSTDQDNNIEAPKTVQVKIDKTAPTLNIQLDKSILWPANNQLIPIQVQVEASDTTSGLATWVLTSINSNYPDPNDIQGALFNTPDTTFTLRAESSGSIRWRVYAITYKATDVAGNTTKVTKKVTVPSRYSFK